VASLSQGRTAAAQCGLFTYKSVPVIFEPPCTSFRQLMRLWIQQVDGSYSSWSRPQTHDSRIYAV